MKKLHFESPEEFEKLFVTNNKKTNDEIFASIKEAMNANKKIADLWSITFSAHPHLALRQFFLSPEYLRFYKSNRSPWLKTPGKTYDFLERNDLNLSKE